jgi:Domain of unknown function (DUF4062)
MDKRYQVFVSSTYADLRNERDHVFQTLMKMDCTLRGWNFSRQWMKSSWHS